MGSEEGMEWLHKEAHKTNESSLVESNCTGPERQNVAAQKQTRQTGETSWAEKQCGVSVGSTVD